MYISKLKQDTKNAEKSYEKIHRSVLIPVVNMSQKPSCKSG